MSIEQGSQDWFAARCGKVTASRVADVIARTKSGFGASRANYAAQLVAERLTGTVAEAYTNAAMVWGIESEPSARAAYEARTGLTVETVGFVPHPTIAMAGASPDGLVGEEGLVEIKCPNTATHIETLMWQEVPGKYLTQMQFQMACTDRVWCDFVSFDPRMPPHLQLFVKRIERAKGAIFQIEEDITKFLSEIDHTVSQLAEMYGQPAF